MNWTDAPWLGFDTETTGVDVRTDRLVTAALVLRAEGGRSPHAPDVQRTWLADPGVEIPARATAVHGISTERARAEGRPVVEVLDEVATALIDHWRQGHPVVAFNAAYDLSLVDNELRRHDLGSLEERLGSDPAPVIDPLVLDRELDRYRKGKKTLALMAPAYGVALAPDAHTAEVDVEMTLDVLAAMAARFPRIARMDGAGIHRFQVEAHRRWADRFGEWLRSRGRTDDVCRTWPQA
jgi:DNA polymerase-3 subunit epsilon